MDVVNDNEEIKTLMMRGTISDYKIIVVIGLPASGKTYFTEILDKACADHCVFHTDDYIHFGYEDSLYRVMSDIKEFGDYPIILEGVQAYRALRKGLQNQDFFPDLIITCECDQHTLYERREIRKATQSNQAAFDKNLQKVYLDYLSLLEAIPVQRRPKFLTYQTGV